MKQILAISFLLLLDININAQLYTPDTAIAGPTGNNNVGVGTSSPSGKLGIGNQEDIISTSGITLGSDQSTIEFVGSNWASGYGHKIFSEDIGTGVNLNIAGRKNSGNWLNIITFQDRGNIGIGTTTPQSSVRLDVRQPASGTAIAGYAYDGNGGSSAILGIGYSSSGEGTTYGVIGSSFGPRPSGTNVGGHFSADGAPNNYALITGNGNVGIGTSAPLAMLDVNGDIFVKGKKALASDGTCTYIQSKTHLYFETSSSSKMILTSDGKLGIGTLTPGKYLLNVSGTIRANEIVVNTSGADFVFESGYKLAGLEEIENYIEENKHLPGVPSAKSMQEEGMSMSEMQTTLLQKIEEITLYLIELKKENSSLKNELQQLRGEKK
ncbi:MAG TPA: hypothetical protein VHO50_13655 [Bacteroidales bacterium]|nr:hypothetical protein [Bacteroidales bacterium]